MVNPTDRETRHFLTLKRRVDDLQKELSQDEIPSLYFESSDDITIFDDVTLTVNPFNLTTTLVDDFEDGDATPLAPNWSNWSVDFQTTATNPVAGSVSGLLSGSQSQPITITNRDTPTEILEFAYKLSISNQTGFSGDSCRLTLIDGDFNTTIVRVNFQQDGNINHIPSGTALGSWSANTAYRFRAYNIDYSAETYDVEVVRLSDDSTIASGAGLSFLNSTNQADNIRGLVDNEDSATTVEFRFDDIEVTF